MIPLLLAPLLATLAQNGLGMLASAITAKGKEVIEEKLGVDIDLATQTPEGLFKLKELEMKHEEFLINAAQKQAETVLAAEKVAQENVTDRWKADMSSDSLLSKNIRPMALIYLTIAFTGFILIDGFVESFKPDSAYVSLLAELLKMVYTAYFVGRTIEKGMEMYQVHQTVRSQNVSGN
jgi:hypothetical protein